ncbi:MAG: hypothetical protein ACYS3N_00880 [Planctomycetota bacterium]
MIKSRKLQIILILTLAFICIPLSGVEPDEATTELDFEIRSTRPPTFQMNRLQQPPFESTHFAILFIKGQWNIQPINENEILATSAARTMSPIQREHVSTLPYKFVDFGRTIGNHSYFRLYGVGEYDTQKMVNAFIEVLANNADKEVQHYLNEQQETQKEIAEIKKELPEKQKQYDEAKAKYNEIMNTRYFPDNPNETYRKAMETVFQMDKTLDTLEIELAGIQSKLKSLESYRRTKRLPRKAFSDETVDKLDQMFVEQMVELRGVEARKKAALGIRNREKEFLALFSRWSILEEQVKQLQRDLKNSENNLHNVQETLANPRPDMLQPKVFQNKVTIYPVKFMRGNPG